VFKRSGRLIALVASALVVAGAATAANLLLPPRQTSDVAEPAPDATPEQVVTVFLEALNAHDCGTAKAVVSESAKESVWSWCERVAGLTSVDVGDHVTQRAEYSGRVAPEEVVYVPVEFDLSWRPLRTDGSMDEGPTTWGYLLVRDSPDSPWRIFDQGVG